MSETRVLIIDDEPLIRQAMADYLAECGYETTTVADGAEGLAQARTGRFHAVLVDLRMPRIDGLEVIATLKTEQPELPVVVVSGTGVLRDAIEAMRLGAWDYITKPVQDMDEIVVVIEQVLDKAGLMAERRRAEEALQAAHDQLERRVQERTTELTEANAALQAEIAERKRVEKALRESEERFRNIFENSPIGIYQTTPAGRILVANPTLVRMLGYSSFEELVQRNLESDTYYPSYSRADFKQRVEGEGQIVGLETTWGKKDGSILFVRENARVVRDERGNVLYYEGTAEDISERVRAEEEIRQRSRELALLNRVIAVSATVLEAGAILETTCRELVHFFEVSYAAAALLNREKGEAVVVAEYRTDDQPLALNRTIPIAEDPSFQYLLRHRAPLVLSDAQYDRSPESNGWLTTDNHFRDLLFRRGISALLCLPLVIEGEVVGSLSLESVKTCSFSAKEISLAWSIADQIAGALARVWLDEDRRRLSIAIDQAAESVMITDTEAAILYVNPAFEQLTGYSRAEAIGRNPRLLKSGKQNTAFYQELWATISSGAVWHGRMVNKNKDGTLCTVDTTITPVRDESGHIVNYVGLQRDITRELQLEEQYHQAQKMEAIGLLAGGIAHDFNNLLTAINGFTELMRFELSPDDPTQELVDKILSSGRRAANLVRQLLAFSRKQIIEPRVVDLNSVVAEMEKMLRRIIGEHIQMETILAPDLWRVRVDPSQIEQVIVNLAVNARDAMPDGGRLTIETANVVLDEEYVADHLGAQPGEYVRLIVSDTGIGMSEEVKARIFEPFFTTKEMGRGTGLGLATIYGIVQQSGGHIWVYSEAGQGTVFKVYLPHAAAASTVQGEDEQAGNLPQGIETVLLVEDETAVRELAALILREQGYTVLEAANGQEALRLAQEHKEEIQLLLTDVIMPGINGKDLAEQLIQTRPGLKLLFTSGYADSMIAHHGVLDPAIPFIEKPFSLQELARKVREVLDA